MCRIHPRREQRGQLLSGQARRSGFGPSEQLPPLLPGRAGRPAVLPVFAGRISLSSSCQNKPSRKKKKKNQPTTHDFQQEKLCSLSGKREISAAEAETPQSRPSCRCVLGGPETPGLMGCCLETAAPLGAHCPPAAFLLCFPLCRVRFAGVSSCQELALGRGNLSFHLQCDETGFEQ